MDENDGGALEGYHLTSAIARLQTARDIIRAAIKYARPAEEIEQPLLECLQQIRAVEIRLARRFMGVTDKSN